MPPTAAPPGPRSAAGGPAAAAWAAALLLLTLAAFSPLARNGFVLFDDDDYITRNAVVQGGLTLEGVRLALTRSYAGNWFPLTWLSHMLDVELFGLDPRGHHLMSLALHAAAALLFLLLLRGMTGRAGPSFLAAALFAVHPLRVESVAWAAERKDVLSALLWMATTALYLRYARRPGAGRYAAMLLCFGLGLAAKQTLVTLPLVLLLLDYWPLGRWRQPVGAAPGRARRLGLLALEKLPLLALAVVASRLAVEAQRAAGLIHSFATFPLAGRVANAVLAPASYLARTAWPVDLSVFYPYAARSPLDGEVLAVGALLAAASAAALLLRRQPWLATGWLWFLGTLVPVMGLVQIGDHATADRYTYLPHAGLFVAVIWTLEALGRAGGRRSRARLAAAGVALASFAALAHAQSALWRDDETLFGHAWRATQGNWHAAYHLGRAREVAGDDAGTERWLRDSIGIKPDFASSRLALARLLHRRGRDEEALAALREGVAADPRSRRLQLTLARALRDEGRTAEMLAALRAGVAALPGDHELRLLLAHSLADAGLDEEAATHYREAIRRWPALADSYNNLAVLLARRGRQDEARALLERALAVDPDFPGARTNLEALAGGR